jgi:hypothetical protein
VTDPVFLDIEDVLLIHLADPPLSDAQDHRHQLVFLRLEPEVVQAEERDGSGEPDALVPVREWVVLDQVEE